MPPRKVSAPAAPKAKAGPLKKAGEMISNPSDKSRKSVPDAPPRPASQAGGQEALAKVLEKLFEHCDTDQDGAIERVEFLDAEERRLGRLEFGPKQRREAVAWFKEAGAEGTPVQGMFVSREKWNAAIKKLAEDAVGTGDAKKQAEWIFEHRLKALQEKAQAEDEAKAARAKEDDARAAPAPPPVVSDAPPVYPLKVPFKDVAARIKEARSWNKTVLVLSSGLSEVETYLNYQHMGIVDAKLYINEIYVKKAKSQDQARAEVKKKFEQCMQNESHFCKPIHVRLANTAFDLVKFCGDGVVPQEMFNPEVWTPEFACKKGFIDQNHQSDYELEDQKRWKDFHIVISSTFGLEAAKEHLTGMIPHFDKLAILEVDPDSIAKGP
jgi:hypothetical protein